MPRLSIHKVKLDKTKLLKIRRAGWQGHILTRIDILHNTYIIIYTGKRHTKWLEDIGYEYE